MRHDEILIHTKAAALGLALPAFPAAEHSGAFAQWAERVLLAEGLILRDRPADEALAECDRVLGHAA